MADHEVKNLEHVQDEVPEELENVKLWWEQHGNLVTAIIVAVAVVMLGVRLWNGHVQKAHDAAAAQLRNAYTTEALEAVVAEGSDKEIQQMARLRLAQMQYGDEEWQLAADTWQAFLDADPKHPLADIARSGIAHCLEAEGKLDEAIDAYTAFAEDYSGSFLASDALIGEARCLVLKGGDAAQDGKSKLDLFLAENAGSFWASQADEVIKAMGRIRVPEAKSTDEKVDEALQNFIAAPAAEAPAPAAAAPAPAAAE